MNYLRLKKQADFQRLFQKGKRAFSPALPFSAAPFWERTFWKKPVSLRPWSSWPRVWPLPKFSAWRGTWLRGILTWWKMLSSFRLPLPWSASFPGCWNKLKRLLLEEKLSSEARLMRCKVSVYATLWLHLIRPAWRRDTFSSRRRLWLAAGQNNILKFAIILSHSSQ